MKFFVGLGNPGKEYQKTRHNLGFQMVDQLAEFLREKQGIGSSIQFQFRQKFLAEVAQVGDVMLIKPNTYMNESGRAVQAVLHFYHHSPEGAERKLEDLYVFHDDLDLETGNYKIQFGRGPKVHNGLASIYQSLQTKLFWHVRLGVDSRKGDRSIPPPNYVLSPFHLSERSQVDSMLEAVLQDLSQRLKL